MRKKDFEEAVSPKETLKINFKTKKMMNLTLPDINIEKIPSVFNYNFIETSSELDIALLKFLDLIEKLVRLAELHKICGILSSEIERTRRRTNALEYILIPSIKETIDYITDRLSESERENICRLMRIKEIIRAH
jgi:V/A-type H+-transporting ATPase subunit D